MISHPDEVVQLIEHAAQYACGESITTESPSAPSRTVESSESEAVRFNPAPVVPLASELPARLVVDSPLPEQLAKGYVVVRYRAENLRILPKRGRFHIRNIIFCFRLGIRINTKAPQASNVTPGVNAGAPVIGLETERQIHSQMKHAEDHFSSIASQYALGRIGYPEDLYGFLDSQCKEHDLAWDCATGSGQAALGLARTFSKVIATDISQELLALAPPQPCISYRAASAEESGLEPGTVDLVTVAQALHWFDLPRFWPEVMRVLKMGGVMAFWGYNWPVVDSGVDRVLEDFKAVISSSWPERSCILHEGYRSICPPLREISCPAFEASAQWNLDDYLAHLRSWSAVRYYRERTGEDITEQFRLAFAQVWGDRRAPVKWPLIMRVFLKG